MTLEDLIDLEPQILFATSYDDAIHIFFRKGENFYDLFAQYSGSWRSDGYSFSVTSMNAFPNLPENYGSLYMFDEKTLKKVSSVYCNDYNYSYGSKTGYPICSNIFAVDGKAFGITKKVKILSERQLFNAMDEDVQETLLENPKFSKLIVYLGEIEPQL